MAEDPGAPGPVPDPASRPGSPPTAVDRVRAEGGSPAIARWVGRAERAIPAAGPVVGFWATVYARFARHRGSVLAGGLAFFGLLSLVPAFISLGALVALVYNPVDFAADVQQLIADRPEVIPVVQSALTGLEALNDTSLTTIGVAGIVSLLISLYAASRFVYVGRQVLDIAFELDPQPPSMLSRSLAVLITLLAQLAVVLGVVVLTVVPRILEAFGLGQTYSSAVNHLRAPATVIMVYLLLTASMRFGTHARRVVPWLNLGAALGALLILLGSFGLSWYLTVSATYSQIVAVLGGVIALELWLYLVGLAIVGAAEVESVRNGFVRRDASVGPVPSP